MRRVTLAEDSSLRDAWIYSKRETNSTAANFCYSKLSESHHICCIFEKEDDCATMLRSFFLGGILSNEKILYLIEKTELMDFSLNLLKDETFVEIEEVEDGTQILHKRSIFDFYNRGQIVFLHHSESYLLDNCFNAERSIEMIKKFREDALNEGYTGSRITGTPTFAHQHDKPGTTEELMDYETRLNYFFSQQSDCHAWCQYHKYSFPYSTLLGILTTHPTAVINNEIYENFYYIPPDELIDKENVQQATLKNWMSNLKTKKKMDADLRDTNTELTKVNNALVQEINKRRQVEREKDEAQALNRAKSQFMATISHEIRTPLTGILGTSALLMQAEDLSKDHQESISIIQSSGDHLLAVINDVLTFSKLESGKFSLASTPFDLKQSVKNVTDMFRLVAKQREMTVECNIDTDSSIPQYVKGDPTRLRQVLFNLVSNAVKFTPNNGRITLQVSATKPTNCENEARVDLQFTVSDTGIGISKEKFDFIFDSFSQIDSSHERQYEGTGLGLSISKKIVEAWNGTIWVASEAGEGSQFYFTLPTEKSEPPIREVLPSPFKLHGRSLTESLELSSEDSDTTERPAKKQKRRKLSIMVADDNLVNKKVLCKMLERLGHVPEVIVSNGLEVVEEVMKRKNEKTQQLDVILLDLQMPKMSGLEASRWLAKCDDWGDQRKPTIVCVTASVLIDDQDRCKEAGMEYHLAKPIKIEMLDSLLQKISSSVL